MIISFTVIDRNGDSQLVEAPDDMNLSLMEILKGSGYDVLATCGGMALCATCHVDVKQGAEQLPDPGDAELDMIDTLPNATSTSRLACQLRIGPALQDATFEIKEAGVV